MNERDLDMRESLPGAGDENPSAGSTTPAPESDLLRLKEAGFEVYGWVPMEADE